MQSWEWNEADDISFFFPGLRISGRVFSRMNFEGVFHFDPFFVVEKGGNRRRRFRGCFCLCRRSFSTSRTRSTSAMTCSFSRSILWTSRYPGDRFRMSISSRTIAVAKSSSDTFRRGPGRRWKGLGLVTAFRGDAVPASRVIGWANPCLASSSLMRSSEMGPPTIWAASCPIHPRFVGVPGAIRWMTSAALKTATLASARDKWRLIAASSGR